MIYTTKTPTKHAVIVWCITFIGNQFIYALSMAKWKYGTTKFSVSIWPRPSTLQCGLKLVACPSHKRCQRILGLCFKTEGKLGYYAAKSTAPVALTAQNETVSKQLQEIVSSSYSEQPRNFKCILTQTTLVMARNFQNNWVAKSYLANNTSWAQKLLFNRSL